MIRVVVVGSCVVNVFAVVGMLVLVNVVAMVVVVGTSETPWPVVAVAEAWDMRSNRKGILSIDNVMVPRLGSR